MGVDGEEGFLVLAGERPFASVSGGEVGLDGVMLPSGVPGVIVLEAADGFSKVVDDGFPFELELEGEF